MMLRYFLVPLFLIPLLTLAQTDKSYEIQLDHYAKDERFYKFQLTLATFDLKNDTMWSMDFESMRKTQPIRIQKPDGYPHYAYGYLFFTGSSNPINPGYVAVLVGGPYTKHPHLFLDINQDFDFRNDPRYVLPYYDEPGVEIELANATNTDGKIKVLLTRNTLFGKNEFRTYMDEYYKMTYPGRKFVGVDYSYREQRFNARAGWFKSQKDSFQIALYDANSNGLYNDPDTDKVVFINPTDSIFDANNPISFQKLAPRGKSTFFEKNSIAYEVTFADAAGKRLDIRETDNAKDLGRIAVGKKAPKVKFTLYTGQKKKLKKFNRKEVYIYFAGDHSHNFTADTLMLRQIALLDSTKLKVICVLFFKKSYLIRIFGESSTANYLIAQDTRELNRKLGIRSLPQSLWLGKRRRVKAYGLKPNEFLREWLKEQNAH